MATQEPASYGVGKISEARRVRGLAPGHLGLVASARALALIRGRDFVLPHDVSDLAADVISHRLVLTFDALADGVNPRQVVDHVVSVVPAPQIASHRTPEQQRDGAA